MGDKYFFKYIGREGLRRVRFRVHTRKGWVTDFLVQFEVSARGRWYPVVRYDFAHGFPHRDLLSPKGEEEKTPLKLETLEQCLQYAEQDLLDRHEWYVSRFMERLR